MSEHHIRWEFHRDYVHGEVVCTAPPDANCRLRTVKDADCDCESYTIERDEQGPFHRPDGWEDVPSGPMHRMEPGEECNVALWLENDLEECAAGRVTFEIGTTPITPVWQGDYYEWKPATNTEEKQ